MIYNSNEFYDELLTCSNKVLIHEKEFGRYKSGFYETIFYN